MTRLLPVLAMLALAADWPIFRGPSGDGHVPKSGQLPKAWGPERNVVWKVEVPGEGWSSPVVVDGRIYLTSAVPAGEKEFDLVAMAYDAEKGKQLWQTTIFHEGKDAPRIHSKNSRASPTAIVDHGKVYVHFGHMGTACLDTAGAIVWKKPGLYSKPVHGNGGTPILVDDKLIFSCDGTDARFVVALDARTGEVAWKTQRTVKAAKPFSFSTPSLIDANGQRLVVSPGSSVVDAIDPSNGEEVWHARYGDGFSVIPKPVAGHGMVYVCTGYGTPNLLAIRTNGTGDVTDSHIAWQTKRSVPHTPSLLLVGDELYMVSDGGIATCLDAKTGKVRWSERLGGAFSASPIYSDGTVIFVSEEGNVTLVAASTTYKVLSKVKLGEKTFASFAVVDKALYVRTAKHLYRFEER